MGAYFSFSDAFEGLYRRFTYSSDRPLVSFMKTIKNTSPNRLIIAKSIQVKSLGQVVRRVLVPKLTAKVNTQLMKVLTDVALSLQISEMYSQTMGPGPNSKKRTKATTEPNSSDELSFVLANHITTRQPIRAV